LKLSESSPESIKSRELLRQKEEQRKKKEVPAIAIE
jgi:hypothetical protein